MCPYSTTHYLFHILDILKESVGNLWLSLRPICELQGKVTESELRQVYFDTLFGGNSMNNQGVPGLRKLCIFQFTTNDENVNLGVYPEKVIQKTQPIPTY